MAIDIPTIDSLSQKIRGYFNANMTGVDAYLPQTFLYVTAKVVALGLYPLYYLMSYVSRQIFVSTADTEYLNIHASERQLSRNPSSKASGFVIVVSVAGQSINAGDVISRADGIQYVFLTSFVTTGNDTVEIESVVEGSSGNAIAGTVMTLVITNSNITSITVGTGGISGGAEEETDEALRSRILFRKRNLALVGTKNYFAILLQDNISGVTRVFVDDPRDGSGDFTIYFMMDDTYTNGIPQSGDVANAQAIVDDGYLVGTNPTVSAPSLQIINVSFTVFEPISATQEASVRLEIEDMIREEGSLSTTSDIKIFRRENIDSAIARALKSNNFTVTAPSSDVTITAGKIPSTGTITITVS